MTQTIYFEFMAISFFIHQGRVHQTLYIRSQIENILGFMGHMVSSLLATIQMLSAWQHFSVEEAIDNT